MESASRIRRLGVSAFLAVALGTTGWGAASAGSPAQSGMPGKGNPPMKPGRQVAPAVTARLLPMRMVCGARVTGSGTVTMIPVHVGAFPGPHVDLVVNLRAARMMHQYGISAAFTGRPPIAWSGMAVSVTSSMRGNLHIRTRLMPMLRAGRYTARVMVHDMGCGSMMHYPLAYETPLVHIVLR